MTLLCTALLSLSLGAQDLTILHINDTHSHIDPQRAGDYKGRGGVIEQAAFIDSVRTAVGKRNVLLLHAGDYGQGTSYFTELGGNIEIDVMNASGMMLSARIMISQELFWKVSCSPIRSLKRLERRSESSVC